jgi:dissimilatory sulfite reductase related protein
MTEFDPAHDPTTHQLDAGDVEQRLTNLGGREVSVDSEGFLWHAEDWTEKAAVALAAECGIDLLSDSQWRVVRFLREYFLYNGRAPLNRDIKSGVGMSLMELECLFPGGIRQGARRIAGLPNPKTCAG